MYQDNQGVEYPYVHLLTETQEGYLPGWYFNDETEDLHGPFTSLEETVSGLNHYLRWLNGDACGTASSPLQEETICNTLPKRKET